MLTNPYLLVAGQVAPDTYTQVQQSLDLTKIFNYADKDTENERIISIISSSPYLALGFIDTYNYEQAANGKFRIVNVIRTRL